MTIAPALLDGEADKREQYTPVPAYKPGSAIAERTALGHHVARAWQTEIGEMRTRAVAISDLMGQISIIGPRDPELFGQEGVSLRDV